MIGQLSEPNYIKKNIPAKINYLRMAPFGNNLITNKFKNTCIYLFVGSEAWTRAKRRIANGWASLCLPPDAMPESFQWPVKDKDILIIETSPIADLLIKRLAYCLLKAKASMVYVALYFKGVFNDENISDEEFFNSDIDTSDVQPLVIFYHEAKA